MPSDEGVESTNQLFNKRHEKCTYLSFQIIKLCTYVFRITKYCTCLSKISPKAYNAHTEMNKFCSTWTAVLYVSNNMRISASQYNMQWKFVNNGIYNSIFDNIDTNYARHKRLTKQNHESFYRPWCCGVMGPLGLWGIFLIVPTMHSPSACNFKNLNLEKIYLNKKV